MGATPQPTHLRCEYFTNPIGIDARKPRLSWRLADDRRGARQVAYRILVAESLRTLHEGYAELWDSGRVGSDQTAHVVYDGKALRSRQRCWWTVRTWNTTAPADEASDGEASGWSDPAVWEMGLLSAGDWAGHWIGSNLVGGPFTAAPCPFLRKRFTIEHLPENARLCITALGLYEAYINGRRVGEDLFTPGRTEYRHRVAYQTYDVTSMLREGENVIGAILGDGWYCGHVHTDPRQYYGDRPRLLAQLVLEGPTRTRTIPTDETWKAAPGPIRSSDILMGEDYDARLEMPGWNAPGFNDAGWTPAVIFGEPNIDIVASAAPRVRRTQEIQPIAQPLKLPRKRWIFDLGQNMVGRVRLRVSGPAGTTIAIRHAEMLDRDGSLYMQALRSARATDHYTLKGDGVEEFEPRFTFHGFRYVELKNFPGEASADTVTGIVIHSDTPPTGSFECSDPMLNRLQRNITWSQRGNFLEIPTDCPQRDERLGWTGDAQVFARTAAFNMDVAGFFTKWMQDVADAQRPDGAIPSVVPDCPSIPNEGGPAWADAVIIVPWAMYLCYGDTRILESRWAAMAKFMDYLHANCRNHIRADESWKWRGYGDWLSHNAETPKDLIGTAFYAHCAMLMAKIAGILGKPEEQARYRELLEKVRSAWRRHYVTPDGLIVGQTQTAHVLALHFDLLADEHRPAALRALVRDIESRGMHLSTGFVGTPYLPWVLSELGRADVAYALLNQRTLPSWLYPITQGATTMWERWDGWTPEKGFNDAGMNSYNHYAYGAVGAWLYAAVAGLDLDSDRPGYRHIRIRPIPGGGLKWAQARLESMHGLIESAWKIEDHKLRMHVLIPPNTTATVRIPTADAHAIREGGHPVGKSHGIRLISQEKGFATFDVVAGKYSFTSPIGG